MRSNYCNSKKLCLNVCEWRSMSSAPTRRQLESRIASTTSSWWPHASFVLSFLVEKPGNVTQLLRGNIPKTLGGILSKPPQYFSVLYSADSPSLAHTLSLYLSQYFSLFPTVLNYYYVLFGCVL